MKRYDESLEVSSIHRYCETTCNKIVLKKMYNNIHEEIRLLNGE